MHCSKERWLVHEIVGKHGCNMRNIHDATGCKLRVRGYGSGYLEDGVHEAPVPLMLAISAEKWNKVGFKLAVHQACVKLKGVEDAYVDICRGFWSDWRLFAIGDLSRNGHRVFAKALRDEGLFPRPFGYESYDVADYDTLGKSVRSTPWVSDEMKEAFHETFFLLYARPPSPEKSEAQPEEVDDSDLPEVISSQVNDFLQTCYQ